LTLAAVRGVAVAAWAAVGAMLVVVAGVDREDSFEVPSVHDLEPVETFAADGPDPPFDGGVRAGCAHGVRMVRIPLVRKTSSNAAVNLLARS
jgi:hypothetical protein